MAALVEQAGSLAHARRHRAFRALVVIGDAALREAVVHEMVALGATDVVQAGTVGEGRVRARAGAPCDVTVAEAALPDGSGIALLAELRESGWSHGIVLSALEDPYTVRAALAAGVRCFLVDRPRGGTATTPVPMIRTRRPGPDGLSQREIEVLELVADGRSNRAIGDALGLSALTVKSHLARIGRKLGTGDRAQLVALALRAGVIS